MTPTARAQVIYLSGPMSGIPEYNFSLFERVTKALRVNRQVLSPHEFPNHGKPWEDCLRYDLVWVCQADAIALLPGWEASSGATLELAVALSLGLPAYTVVEVHDSISRAEERGPPPPS